MSDIEQEWIFDWDQEAPELPKLDLIRHTPDPVKTACLAARGDYYKGYVYEEPYEQVMEEAGQRKEERTDEEMTLEEKEAYLIKKCIRRGHYGILEHVSLTFGVKGMSRACMAQITRHRLISFDIQSQRYVDFSDVDQDQFHVPPSFEQSEVKSREGRKNIDMSKEERLDRYWDLVDQAVEFYNDMVDAGVPKEHARMGLPIGTRVNATMSMNLRHLLHILDIRGAGDAQGEINYLAYQMATETREAMPRIMEIYFDEMYMRKNRLSP
jgi:thymidylate synthase (FAD)